MTEYYVPAGYGESEYSEKHSRFIGHIWFVSSEEEALARIREMREKHWDARHNVYAYVLREGNTMRYSDDGEPQGTGGMPVLNVLRGAQLANVCCVVTRYFGGILLGTGGLVRAYTQATKDSLEAAGIAVVRLWHRYKLSLPYHQFERMKSELTTLGCVTECIDYGSDISMEVLVPENDDERFRLRITDFSAGSIKPVLIAKEEKAVCISGN